MEQCASKHVPNLCASHPPPCRRTKLLPLPKCATGIANYLASLVQTVLFAHATCEEASSGSYDEVCNLRRQAEKMAAQDQLFKRKDPSWISWEEVQQTRVAITNAYNAANAATKRSMIRDVVIVLLHSITPPDRVG